MISAIISDEYWRGRDRRAECGLRSKNIPVIRESTVKCGREEYRIRPGRVIVVQNQGAAVYGSDLDGQALAMPHESISVNLKKRICCFVKLYLNTTIISPRPEIFRVDSAICLIGNHPNVINAKVEPIGSS